MKVRFWGTRGSIATPGAGTVRFGGNTSCVEMTTDRGECFIFDCGAGAHALGHALMARNPPPTSITILLSHTIEKRMAVHCRKSVGGVRRTRPGYPQIEAKRAHET